MSWLLSVSENNETAESLSENPTETPRGSLFPPDFSDTPRSAHDAFTAASFFNALFPFGSENMEDTDDGGTWTTLLQPPLPDASAIPENAASIMQVFRFIGGCSSITYVPSTGNH